MTKGALAMLNKIRKLNSEKGFTIIEVMIVLAIAGLIILIVLLAVPALQRNGRNTAIKNDASALAAGVAEYASNNDGKLPVAASSSQSGASVTFSGGAATTPSDSKVQGSTTVSFTTDPTQAGQIRVQFGAKCTASNSLATTANTRSTAIKYLVEKTAGATDPRCLDS
jgi:prepilin-type N-terminal cleavage/methylation domain-containing protein